MPTYSKPETDTSPKKQTKEWIDKIVSDTFDELFTEIIRQKMLHPTEQYGRKNPSLEPSALKIYDVINSYHGFCKLCDQHFYSLSLENDTNSFFQKHINTSYHKQMLMFNLPPNNAPMFTWERKFLSGRCNVCDMSGLNSYVLDTKFTPSQLLKTHFCIWDQENRETNEKVLRKLNLLKKFCGLTIFRKLYIKRVNEREVCLLCGINLPWSGENARYHLFSSSHYQKFCVLLQKCFNFAPQDALNGFNLEMIIRWLINNDFAVLKEFINIDEREICFERSNSNENPYSDEKDNFSYCPKSIEKSLKTEETDFIYNKECLLCNVPFHPGHITSEQHQIKMISLDVESFDTLEKYVIYCRKREKRLHIIENYRNLKLEDTCEPLSPKKNRKAAKRTPSSKIKILEMLFKKKLQRVGLKFVRTNQEKIFCEVCDRHVSKEESLTHLKSFHHKSQEVKWLELKAQFATARFMDPFQKIKNVFACLLCGAVFNTKSFVSHLKGDTHMRKFIWYSNLNNSIPISSGLVVRADSTSHCTICKEVLSKKMSSSLKMVLKNIRLHWPCPKIKDEKSEATTETSEELIEKNQNTVQEVSTTCLTCGRACIESEMKCHSISCSKNTIDFIEIEKKVENIVNIFEKKIINNAFYKSAYLISSLDNSSLIATKEKIKKSLEMEGQQTAYRETSCGYDHSLKNLHLDRSSTKSDRKKDDEKCEEFVKNEIRIQMIENNIKKQKKKKPSSQDKKVEKLTGQKVKKKELTSKEEKKEEPTCKEEKKELAVKKEKEEEPINKEKKVEELTTEEEKEEEPINKEEKVEELTTEEEKEEEPINKEEKVEELTTAGEEMEEPINQNQKEKRENEKEHEILLIEGLPKNKRKLKTILSKFSDFGKIRYAFFEGRTAVLAFVEPGMAEKVAKGPSIFVNDHKLYLTISTRKAVTPNEEKISSLNGDLVYLLQDPQKLMDFILNLIVQAVAASDSLMERRREEFVCSTIISAVLKYFPTSRCYPFGSRLSGLMLNNSDLDVFLDCGDMYEGFKNTSLSSERKLVNKVANLLKKKQEITEIVVVSRARVPIVSFLHLPTLMRCDLSFKNGLSIQNTLLIKFMLSLDWRVRPLILFLKYWTKLNGLHGPPYFSSYAIAMLVIYYLEQLERPVLPTIEYLQSSYSGRRTTIGGWDCSINLNTLNLQKSDNQEPLPQLLRGLFEFYAGFDYSTNIISPLTGKPLPREALSPSNFPKLPMCYKRHILNMPIPIQNLVNSKIFICVMDPFDLSHILTKSFSYRGLQSFISCCQASEKHLKNSLSSHT